LKSATADKKEGNGPLGEDEPQSYVEDDDVEGGRQSRGHTVRITGLCNSPLCQQKKKGLIELGDSSLPQRRRSVRLHEKQARSAPPMNHQEGKTAASISDGDIFKCNARLCEQGNGGEPELLWEIGKISGIRCHGNEEEVFQEYVCMEVRDTEGTKHAKEGDKDGLS